MKQEQPKGATYKVLVYGTLRPGNTPTRLIPGVMYDLGAYPGVLLKDEAEGKFITCEEIEVDDSGLSRLDGYEGYNPDRPGGSLYVRIELEPGVFIYQYNSSLGAEKVVESGDWLEHTNSLFGRAAGLGGNSRGLV